MLRRRDGFGSMAVTGKTLVLETHRSVFAIPKDPNFGSGAAL
jgi:hypothetical protein